MLASLMIHHFEIFFISLFSYFCDIGNTDENLSSNVRVAKGRMSRERGSEGEKMEVRGSSFS